MTLNPFFFEIHGNLPREGPGSDASTLRALKAVSALPKNPRIADIGCGPGRSSLILAKETGGYTTSVDIHQSFLDTLKDNAAKLGLSNAIEALNADMAALPFKNSQFDLIWSEGAIYLLGLENGLRLWSPFLKKNGYIVISHISWLTRTPSQVAADFWQEAYPSIAHVDDNLEIFEKANFNVTDYFTLPKSDWWNEYYAIIEKRIAALIKKYPDHMEAQTAARDTQREIDVWKDHGDDYGYVFYIAQKI